MSDMMVKLKQIVADTLELDMSDVTDDISSDNCANWDSIKHLTLVLAVEDAFGVMFDEKEIPRIMSFPSLFSALGARLPG